MRNVNCNVASSADYSVTNGSQIDSNQLVSASFHCYFGDASAAGTFKLQMSNDISNNYYNPANFTVTHWTDIPTQTVNLTGGAAKILTIPNMTYRWIRAVYTPTAAGVQTIAPVADDGGSLNSTYFLLQDGNSANLYYVWISVDGTGVDPMIAGRVGVPVAISEDDTAADVGTALASAIDALATFTASGTTTVTVTNTVSGPFIPMSDGAAPTGFTFAVTTGGSTTVNVNMNALSI